MKHFILALFILLFCASIHAQAAPSETEAEKAETSRLDIEINLGLGMGIDALSGDRWRSEPATSIGLNYNYSPSPRFQIRGGISEQVFSSTRVVEHPYSYVMEMDFNLVTVSTRFLVGGDWVYHLSGTGNSSYLGAAFYTDIVHFAEAHNKLFYLFQEERETLNLKDSFSDPVPGIQVSLGLVGHAGRIELRYWEDVRTFTVPGLPMDKQRRSFFGMAGALYFGN